MAVVWAAAAPSHAKGRPLPGATLALLLRPGGHVPRGELLVGPPSLV